MSARLLHELNTGPVEQVADRFAAGNAPERWIGPKCAMRSTPAH